MKTCVVLALFLMAGVSLGDIQKRIKDGGRPCTEDESKSFVFLGISNQLLRRNFICSGTVIGNGNWILTAKHCEDTGVLGWLFRYFRKFNVKDVTSTVDITSKKTFKHKTADIMLIKVKTGMPGMPLVSQADCSQVLKDVKQTGSKGFVPMVVPARDTKAKDKTGIADVSMCGDIEVDRSGIDEETKEEVVFWSPFECNICPGDSGAGYIYKNALFAVNHGNKKLILGGDMILSDNYGQIVCDGKIREWIDETMKKNP
ncbi:thrombin-like enzyme KN-BJ 2 [Cololabis saira]|uniref:thrombin-like enzyme KN-BJ 2 n=1 Tax=Cololabis saira TaxID=129043 RepID=UPI002AD48D32|nr:thrombin-like enzyme KN-BJ 2 [Cololabis saira]XP_061567993.1 thrombin-like enzyme KN-BJ 2 [Cololabis saira]